MLLERCFLVSGLAALLVFGLPARAQTPTRDENWTRCEGPNPEVSIAGCTALLQSGQESPANVLIALYNRAASYDHKGDYDKAIADYSEVIRLKPDFSAAFNGRGNTYSRKGKSDEAIADFSAAIRLKPDYVFAFNNRCIAYKDNGEYDKALADCTEAIRLKPDDAEAFNNRGIAHDRKHEFAGN